MAFSNTFPSTAVHNQSPHPTLVFCLNPVSERDPVSISDWGGQDSTSAVGVNMCVGLPWCRWCSTPGAVEEGWM